MTLLQSKKMLLLINKQKSVMPLDKKMTNLQDFTTLIKIRYNNLCLIFVILQKRTCILRRVYFFLAWHPRQGWAEWTQGQTYFSCRRRSWPCFPKTWVVCLQTPPQSCWFWNKSGTHFHLENMYNTYIEYNITKAISHIVIVFKVLIPYSTVKLCET